MASLNSIPSCRSHTDNSQFGPTCIMHNNIDMNVIYSTTDAVSTEEKDAGASTFQYILLLSYQLNPFSQKGTPRINKLASWLQSFHFDQHSKLLIKSIH